MSTSSKERRYKHISPKTDKLERCVGPLGCAFNSDDAPLPVPHYISDSGKLYIEDVDGTLAEIKKSDAINIYMDRKFGKSAGGEVKSDFVTPKSHKVPNREDTAIWNARTMKWMNRPLENVTEVVAEDGTRLQVGSFISQDGRNERIYALNVTNGDPENFGQELIALRTKRADVEVIRSRMVAMGQTDGSLLGNNIEYASDNRPTINFKEMEVKQVDTENLKGISAEYHNEKISVTVEYFVQKKVDTDTSGIGDSRTHYNYIEKNLQTGDTFERVEVYDIDSSKLRRSPTEMNPRSLTERMRTLAYRDDLRKRGDGFEYNGSWEKIRRTESGNIRRTADRFNVVDELTPEGEIYRNGEKMPTNSSWDKLDIYKKEREFKDGDIFDLSKFFKSIN